MQLCAPSQIDLSLVTETATERRSPRLTVNWTGLSEVLTVVSI